MPKVVCVDCENSSLRAHHVQAYCYHPAILLDLSFKHFKTLTLRNIKICSQLLKVAGQLNLYGYGSKIKKWFPSPKQTD